MTSATAPNTAAPIPTYCHVSSDIPGNLTGSDASRYPLKGPTVLRSVTSCVILVTALTACSTSQHPGIVGNLVDCGKADRGELLGLVTELGVEAVRDVTTDEAVNWKALGLKAAAKGIVVGGCAFAQFVRGYIQAETPSIAEGTVARVAPDPAILELEALRAQWGGVTWSVER